MLDLSVFNCSRSVVVVIRVADGIAVAASPGFERASGYRVDELIGRSPFDLGVWRDAAMRAQMYEALRSQSSARAMAVEMVARDGSAIPIIMSAELIEVDGGPHVFCLMQPTESAQTDARPVDGYRNLFLEAAEGIYRSFPGGRFVDANPAMARILGYPSAAAMLADEHTTAVSFYVDPEHGRRLHDEQLRSGRIDNVVSRIRNREGKLLWLRENARVVRDAAGNALFFEGTVFDISSEVEAREALRQSEQLYRTLVDNITDGVFLMQQGKLRVANQALARVLGVPLEGMEQLDYLDYVAEGFKAAQAERRRIRESGSGEVFTHELKLRRPDGSEVLLSVRSAGVLYDGVISSTGVVRDITAEHARQQALEQAERKYRELFENSPAGLFQSAMDGSVLEINRRMAQMLGWDDVAELRSRIGNMLEVYADPEERAVTTARCLADGRVDAYPTRVKRRDGSIMWVQVDVRVVRDDAGTPLYFEGSVSDIDAKRRFEQALQRSEEKYRALIEHAQVGVFVLNFAQITYVNHAFQSLVGIHETEIIGRSFFDFLAPESRPAAEERQRLRREGRTVPPTYETCLLHRDGARVYINVSAGMVDIDGVPHLMGTALDVTRQRQAEQRLLFNATHDALTGLPNRTLFQERLDKVLFASRSGVTPAYAVLFLDLDGFKLVNDSLGHAAGDRLLIAIAEKLSVLLASEALIARYGGDEFTLLPHGECDAVRAVQIAERVLGQFASSFDIGGHQVFSGCSMGIVLGRPEYRSPDQVLRDADTAMYRAKAAGKANYVIFDERMHASARRRFQVETDLRLALERNEFRVHYQPIIRLDDARVVGCEALVRWQHPERGLLTPIDFLEIAEEAGLIAEIDWWVMGEACHQLARWRRQFPEHAGLKLNINVDEKQLSDRNIGANISAILRATGADPDAVSLEITETIFRTGRGQAGAILSALKATGVHLVVDDFGTGYSSLDSFASSPFDALKVDRSFVMDMETNRRHLAIVRTITGFAEDLGLALTAEGVETPGQAKLLRDMGCATAQGNLFSKPLDVAAMEKLLGGGLVVA